MIKTSKELNYSLVEDKRPPLYTNMKYWGKKPHNIWFEYIKNYTGKQGVYMDPFSGSAMSAFEGFRAKKKVVALDLNPLTSFIIETYCSKFISKAFMESVKKIIDKICNDSIYKKLYSYSEEGFYIHNVKWNDNEIYEICLESIDKKSRKCLVPSTADYESVSFSESIDFSNMTIPLRKFRKSDSFKQGFIVNIVDNFSSLYTKRNLYVLSCLFSEILAETNTDLRKQLLLGFIQTVHLCTKMCVPRSKETNRDFSTSWGRSAFIYSKRQMEMNPLLLFESSCLKKQSVLASLNYFKKYIINKPKIADINKEEFDINKKIDIWYGSVDAKKIHQYLPEKSVDFILTDPPYGGLVQYMDLSTVWLSWLELVDEKYKPNYDDEITVNGEKDYDSFQDDFECALSNFKRVLKDDGKLVLTFNNNDLQIWNSFLKAIKRAGFGIEKVIFQQNKRTGESNVANKYGMSASDFYLRCVKSSNDDARLLKKEDIESLLINSIKEIIIKRNEPTPYRILFNALLVKLSTFNIDFTAFDCTVDDLLLRYENTVFEKRENKKNLSGNIWWIKEKKYNEESKVTLTNKLREFVNSIFVKNSSIEDLELKKIVFKKFFNEMIPDPDVLEEIIEEVAKKEKEKWVRKNG